MSISRLTRVALLGGALVLVVPPQPARAQDEQTEKARSHFEKGTAFYNLARFKEALVEFEAGYLQKSDPIFLYNIAQCHRQMNNPTEALRFYRTYLRNAPKAPNRADVERRISDLEALQAEQEKARSAAPREAAPLPRTLGHNAEPPPVAPVAPALTPPPPPPPAVETAPAATVTATPDAASSEPPIYKKWWLWTAVGVVVVGATIGLVAASSGGNRPHCPTGYKCL